MEFLSPIVKHLGRCSFIEPLKTFMINRLVLAKTKFVKRCVTHVDLMKS